MYVTKLNFTIRNYMLASVWLARRPYHGSGISDLYKDAEMRLDLGKDSSSAEVQLLREGFHFL